LTFESDRAVRATLRDERVVGERALNACGTTTQA
jgi:hypothetical protein